MLSSSSSSVSTGSSISSSSRRNTNDANDLSADRETIIAILDNDPAAIVGSTTKSETVGAKANRLEEEFRSWLRCNGVHDAMRQIINGLFEIPPPRPHPMEYLPMIVRDTDNAMRAHEEFMWNRMDDEVKLYLPLTTPPTPLLHLHCCPSAKLLRCIQPYRTHDLQQWAYPPCFLS